MSKGRIPPPRPWPPGHAAIGAVSHTPTATWQAWLSYDGKTLLYFGRFPDAPSAHAAADAFAAWAAAQGAALTPVLLEAQLDAYDQAAPLGPALPLTSEMHASIAERIDALRRGVRS